VLRAYRKEIPNPPGHSLSAELLKDIRKKKILYRTHHIKWKGTHWLENVKERNNLETEWEMGAKWRNEPDKIGFDTARIADK